MRDADVFLLRDLKLPKGNDELLSELIEQTPWRSEEVTVWGRKYPQPRLISWHGDPGRSYSYSGISVQPAPWTRTLTELRSVVEMVCGEAFNSVLLNFYRDGRDSMGLHSDDEPELGPRPVIASLSLGEARTFTFKHRKLEDHPLVKIPLESGSLLLMKGDTQRNWKHGISKSSKPLGRRVNLTFRQIR